MNKDIVRIELARLLDLPVSAMTDELQLNTVGNWDSIVWVSLVAFLVGELNYKIDIQKLPTIQTIGDLWALGEA